MTPIHISWWRSFALIILAALTLLLSRNTTPPDIAPEVGVSMNLPTLVDQFWGSDQPVSPSELALLPVDTEFAKKVYQDLTGNTLTAQIVLSGGEKRSIHRPEICLPGQGWSIQSGEVIPIKLSNGHNLDVMKLTLSRTIEDNNGESRTLKAYFLYWFVGAKGSTTPYHWKRLLKTNWDMLTKKINHRWAYIIVNANVLEGLKPDAKTDEETLQMLKDFISESVPKFQVFEDQEAPKK